MLIPRSADGGLIGRAQNAEPPPQNALFRSYQPVKPGTEGLARLARAQSLIVTSNGLEWRAEVTRQIRTSWPKSKRTNAGRGLVNAPEVNGN
jgi:hypothetical protein